MENTTETRNSVLIVDDEEFNLKMLGGILREDYDIRTASGGIEALEKAQDDPPDLILLDVMMPEMDGYETLTALKEGDKTRAIPVIFITGLNSKEDEEKGLALNAADYISKPFSLGIVKLRVKNQIQIVNQIRTIEALGLIDQLTGIPNRRNLDNRFSVEWARAFREKHPISLMMMDIDKFKIFNDTYGHLVGDEVLKLVAASFKHSLMRKSDFAARFGGEEFSILLPNTTTEGAVGVAERVRKGVEQLIIPCGDGKTTKVTLSIGVYTAQPSEGEGEDIQEIISKADQALYNAKETGRNRVCVYGSEELGIRNEDQRSEKLKVESGKSEGTNTGVADDTPQLSTFNSQLSTPATSATPETSAAPASAPPQAPDSAGILDAIGGIDGINLEIGMSHFNGMDDLYVETVNIFFERIPIVVGDMDKALAAGDIESFAISVHSVKSMLATVGASGMSRKAFKLEEAGKDGDMDYCRTNYPDLQQRLLQLKIALSEIFAPIPSPSSDLPVNTSRKKIIHVDDVTYTLVSLKGRLEKHYEIYSVRSYEKLLKVLENIIPDLILLDINLPGTDGFEIIKNLKSDPGFKDIPVVFLTSVGDENSINKGWELGAADIIIKPISDSELIKRISDTIA